MPKIATPANRVKITKRVIDAVTTPANRAMLWDIELKGFGVVLRPTGTHSFVYAYRDHNGRQKNITIAKVGAITPDDARKKAEGHQRTVRDGRSPLAEKQAARKAITVGELFDAYLASDGKRGFMSKSPSTQTVDRGRIERHLRPLLGKHILEALTPADIGRAHRAIVAGKTATNKPSGRARGRIVVTGGEGTARMAIRLFRAIMSWATLARILPAGVSADIAAAVDIGRDGRRGLILEDRDAYARLWKTLDRLVDPAGIKEGEALLRGEAADAIRVIALTGARKSEIASLRWRHLDMKGGKLVLPPDAHKTGGKTGQDRVIGLPALAQAIISRQSAGGPDDLVFMPARGGETMNLTRVWKLVRTAAGLPAGIGLHGLRHSLASWMAMDGHEAAAIMAALGHRDIATSQKYVHWANDKRQELAERAAAGIVAAVSGEDAGVDVPLKGLG